MNRDQKLHHEKKIDAWIEKSIRDQSPFLQAQIFSDLIHALREQMVFKLSEVTWNAILERTLYQCQQDYPLLNELSIDGSGFTIDPNAAEFKNLKGAQVSEALRFFLIELFTIIQNLTAGILVKALYNELERFSQSTYAMKSAERGTYDSESNKRTH